MDIYWNGKVIGQATVTVEGLYATVRCICHFPTPNMYAVILKNETDNRMLGTCTTKGEMHVLEAKLPKKYILKPNSMLYAIEKYADYISKRILLTPGKPIESLSLLEHAFLQMNGGEICLCVPCADQEKESKFCAVNSMNS